MTVCTNVYLCLLCVLCFVELSRAELTVDEELSYAPCPQVLGCRCGKNDTDPTRVTCYSVNHDQIELLSTFYPNMSHFTAYSWQETHLNLFAFYGFKKLKSIAFLESELAAVNNSERRWKSLEVNLNGSYISSSEVLCSIASSAEIIKIFNAAHTWLTEVPSCISNYSIESLNVDMNEIYEIPFFPKKLKFLSAAYNFIENVTLPSSIQGLDLSWNPTWEINSDFPSLVTLNLTGTSFKSFPILRAPLLKYVQFESNQLIMANFDDWIAPSVRSLSMKNSHFLELVIGQLPAKIKEFVLTQTSIKEFPQDFFERTPTADVRLSSRNWVCKPCRLLWKRFIQNQAKDVCKNVSVPTREHCGIGCDEFTPSHTPIVRRRVGDHAILHCGCWSNIPIDTVFWHLYRPSTLLGSYEPKKNLVTMSELTNQTKFFYRRYSILPTALFLQDVDRDMLERYVCVFKAGNETVHRIINLRFDYSSWYTLDIFDSVFYGSILSSLLICLLCFVVNFAWIIFRQTILWWIKRAERLSRVRKMVEAMEKYRVRQLESLHETYSRRLQNVRENYHNQVFQLRQSYASQAERFRDFRDAKMENVSAHIENIRENYAQQMSRVREYGSRRAEQLWESYERQMNRMRMFTLQQRLRMMRQYKVKQRYLNKLLESFQHNHDPETLRKHEEEVRRVLDSLKDDPLHVEPEIEEIKEDDEEELLPVYQDEQAALSRYPSYYSLPEFVFYEDDDTTVTPIVRYHRRETPREKSRRTRTASQNADSAALALVTQRDTQNMELQCMERDEPCSSRAILRQSVPEGI